MSKLNEYFLKKIIKERDKLEKKPKESKAEKDARWAKQDEEERQPIRGSPSEILKKAIGMYSGKTILKIQIHPDPKVAGTYAIRADGMDFLITRFPSLKTYKDIIDNLEDVEWETWPPKSGDLKFF